MKTRVETRFLAWIANCHLPPVRSNWILFNPECSQITHNASWYRTVLWGPQWCSGLQNGNLEHGAWVRVPAPPFTKCGCGAYDHGLLSLLSGKKTLYLGGLLLKIKHNMKKGLESGRHRTRHIAQLNTWQPCFSFLCLLCLENSKYLWSVKLFLGRQWAG